MHSYNGSPGMAGNAFLNTEMNMEIGKRLNAVPIGNDGDKPYA